jgi:membrane protein YqaA with SNARE-associated domain
VGHLAVYAGLFTAALAAATVLPAQSEVALVALLLAEHYPAWRCRWSATRSRSSRGCCGEPLPVFLLLVAIAKTSRYLAVVAITQGWM